MIKKVLHILIYRNKFFVPLVLLICFAIGFLIFSLISKIDDRNKKLSKFLEYPVYKTCDVPLKALEVALEAAKADAEEGENKKENQTEKDSKFVKLISLLGAKYGGDWNSFEEDDANKLMNKLKKGDLEKELSKPFENYHYFKKMYTILLGEMVGSYRISKKVDETGEPIFENKMGLKSYFPIPYGFAATFCDDFEPENKYLSSKFHLGVDVSAKLKTPIVAVESGIVEDCGKSEEFGWYMSIKSFDGLRTYHYANCLGTHPFAESIKPGETVQAGQVIGFVGATSCCRQKAVKAQNCPHLHFALNLNLRIGNKRQTIWINPYNILQFLQHHESALNKMEGEFDFEPKYIFEDPAYENYVKKTN